MAERPTVRMGEGDWVRPKKVYINGRFLRGPITGTSRVAEEVLAEWDANISAGDERFAGYEIKVLQPCDSKRSLDLKNISSEQKDIFGGKFWELIDLGLMSRDGILVNFANVSPIYHPNSVTYIHDAQLFLFPESYPAREFWLHRPLSRLAGMISKRVITVSEFSSQMLQKYKIADRDNIFVIHNGADHIFRTKPDKSVLKAHGLVAGEYVLMFGSTFSYKNNKIVYDAFRRMSGPRPKLAVIARADLREEIPGVEELGDDLVILSGVGDSALRALYENALVFVQPAKTEGFAMTQLEALNSGAPVITSPEGSMREVLADNVVYADANSAEAWRDAILRFRHEPDLRRQALSKGQKMAAHYTWRRTAGSLWDQVLGVAGRR